MNEYEGVLNDIMDLLKGRISMMQVSFAESLSKEILFHPNIAVLADNQELPVPIHNEYLGDIVVMGLKDMKDNWKRIVKKGLDEKDTAKKG